MTEKLIVFLIIGTIAMCIPILAISKKYQIGAWKGITATVLLTIVGTAGTYLMYYLENRRFGGLSFYGAVFLVPVVFLVVAMMLRLSYRETMDLCAVGECIMLALMKVHCMLGGCCTGRFLFNNTAGEAVYFPSRTVELLVALVLFVILLRWALVGKHRGTLYAWYLLLYGSTRFVLNIFREAWTTKQTLLPIGNIWSLLAIAISLIWLWTVHRNNMINVKEQLLENGHDS